MAFFLAGAFFAAFFVAFFATFGAPAFGDLIFGFAAGVFDFFFAAMFFRTSDAEYEHLGEVWQSNDAVKRIE